MRGDQKVLQLDYKYITQHITHTVILGRIVCIATDVWHGLSACLSVMSRRGILQKRLDRSRCRLARGVGWATVKTS